MERFYFNLCVKQELDLTYELFLTLFQSYFWNSMMQILPQRLKDYKVKRTNYVWWRGCLDKYVYI